VFGGVFAFLAGVALVLATMGLYAVMAYSVTQRTQEIGVRVAVGAQPRQVSWLILRTGLARLAMGLAIGIAGASVLSGAVRVLLVDMTATDPVTFGAIALLLSGSALAACVMPVRRALRVDPIVALRAE
jgi:ABC-type antimicrobial peptide transport system permease subunit